MAALNPKQILKNLKKKGFVENNKADKLLELWHNDKYILHTFISHGSKHEADDSLIHKMATQCHLSKKDFMDLARCPMAKQKYIAILKKEGILN